MWEIDTRKQAESLLNSNGWVNIWHGSVRSGKTVISLIRWIVYLKNFVRHKGGDFVMVGKTERTLYRNILSPLMEVFGEAVTVTRGSGEAIIFNTRVLLVGANDERSEQKIRGGTFAGAYCDEITLYPESFFKMLLSRLSVDGSKLFGTTNPDNPSHWLYKDVIENKELGNKRIFHYTINDNPHLTEEYKESLRNAYTGLWYRRFYLGEWVSAHGAIYDMFDKQNHVVNNILNMKSGVRFVSIDYGIQNPCVFGLYNKDGNNYHLISEYYWDGRTTGKQKTDSEYVNDLIKWLGTEKIKFIVIDPSATSFIQSLRKAGFSVKLAKNSVLEGIQLVSDMLVKRKLFIHEKCDNTIREIESYIWDSKASARGVEQPLKTNDHCMDMLRYALLTTKTNSVGKTSNAKMPSLMDGTKLQGMI